MDKKLIKNITSALPNALKNAVGYVKDNFDDAGQEALSNANGTVGVLIKIFAQDKVDSYFGKLTKHKLENYGSAMYMEAALVQAGKSMEIMESDEESTHDVSSIVSLLSDTLEINENTFTKEHLVTIFTPRYHPIVVFIKEKMEGLLKQLNMTSESIKNFKSHFNEHIEATIIETFGSDDYEKHKKEIEIFWRDERESRLLYDMYQLHKIGFKEGESLKYEKTYASWKPVSMVLDKEQEEEDNKKHKRYEESLKPIELLIEEYFSDCTANDGCIKNILFAIADFGKGKSVFLKQYASELAKKYSETKEGYIPIYFNLRDFSLYSDESELGVLGSYLLDVYAIRINDDEFKKNKYIFLIDSLDESGELTKTKINKVINSIEKIQNIDKEKCRDNRIIITSRPFSDGLEEHLTSHKPYVIKDQKTDKEIAQFISLYGFKQEQFNSWLYDTLKNNLLPNEDDLKGFAKEIVKSIKTGKKIDIYEKLYETKTLLRTELRRPIFSYMIYQLIINNVDFVTIGKIGVYLSFINLLTKDAKHVDDKTHSIDQEEEIRYRNILHAISALWMYERQQGKQGILNKADICRVLEEKSSPAEDDKAILERFKNKGVTEIQFLSHSYFGEEDNNLHFQHQSFAEILLAEYYLKVFIKFALETNVDIDMARSKLVLGEPTEQTIQFFKELLYLLKETVCDEPNDSTIEKRKLLYPLFAALAMGKNNTLHSQAIQFKWFDRVPFDKDLATIPVELLNNWVINDEELEKIIFLAKNIIDSKSTLVLAKTEPKNALFNKELTVFTNMQMSNNPTDIDKWLALIVGNLLHTDNIDKRVFFNRRLENPENLFEMIKNWNYSNNAAAPIWANQYFTGIQIDQKKSRNINLNYSNLSSLNFSYSYLSNIKAYSSLCNGTNFTGCSFYNIDLTNSDLRYSIFDNLNLTDKNALDLGMSRIAQYVFIPYKLANILSSMTTNPNSGLVNEGAEKVVLLEVHSHKFSEREMHIFNTLKGLLICGLENNLFDIEEIKSWFEYGNDEIKKEFEKLIDGLEENKSIEYLK